MKVFKFGGASVKSADAVRNVGFILDLFPSEKIAVVVSAMGKTTNALEAIYSAYISNNPLEDLLTDLISDHLDICHELLDAPEDVEDLIIDLIPLTIDRLNVNNSRSHDYIYDQIVACGEYMSTLILHHYLVEQSKRSELLDAKTLIKTNDQYRSAKVKWDLTELNIRDQLIPRFERADIIITQGFIGSSPSGDITTLGREGSDYSGAILASALSTRDYYVWKDVDGIMSADPKVFNSAELLPRLSYEEAIELTYFGAKVIHPKTIQPLQYKSIRLHVRSFINPHLDGTLISIKGMSKYPPIIIHEKNQTLLKIATKDFSFISERHMADILGLLSNQSIKVNMMQNSAVSFALSVHDSRSRLDQVLSSLHRNFVIECFTSLELYTLRYFEQDLIDSLKSNRTCYLEEFDEITRRLLVST